MVLGDGLVNQFIHGLVESMFAVVFAVRFLVERTVCLVTEAFQFLGQVASLNVGAALDLAGLILYSHS